MLKETPVIPQTEIVYKNTVAVPIDPTRQDRLEALSGMDVRAKILKLHEAFEERLQTSGILEFAATDDETRLSEAVRNRVTTLQTMNALLKHAVNPEASDMSSEDVATRETFATVRDAYRQADVETEGMSFEERVARRLQEFDGYQIISDADNTITDQSNIGIENGIDPLLLGSGIGDPLHGPNRERFLPVYAAVWEPLVRDYADVYFQGGQTVPLREGFEDFLVTQVQEGTPITILTTNFRPFIEGVLSQLPKEEADQIRMIAAYPNTLSSEKAEAAKMVVLRNSAQAAIFIGDGGSDLPAVEASDVIAAYFALEGGKFSQQLTERGIEHFTYRTGYDIQQKLDELQALAYPQEQAA